MHGGKRRGFRLHSRNPPLRQLGRNSLRGPNYRQWDLNIYKNTNLTERVTMQLKVEIFNVLNRPNFASPFLPNFHCRRRRGRFRSPGQPGGGRGPTVLGATGDVGIGNPFLGGGGPRGIQLAATFRF